MQVKYVTAINHLKIASDLGRGDKLDDSTFITNNRSIISKLVDQRVIPVMGTLEWSAISEAKTVIYGRYEIDSNAQDSIAFLTSRLFWTKFLFHALWLVLDNAADNDLGFLICDADGVPTVSSNFIATGISKADGTMVVTEISRQQLQTARSLYRKFSLDGRAGMNYTTRLVKHSNRLERALYHIQGARHSSDIALKLVNYCTAAESIFASSSPQGELAHQLSERLACFLEGPGRSRVETYNLFKRAYRFRSRVTHGAAIADKELEEVKRLSFICDDMLRRSIRRLLDDEDLIERFELEDKFNDFFITSLLGG
jgi:hypothetical protein